MRIQNATFPGWHAKAGLLVLLLLAIGGCHGSQSTGIVTGTVTYKNEPVTEGTVTFFGGGGTQVSSAPLDSEGKYTASGVPVGLVLVTVETPAAPEVTKEQAAKNPMMKRKGFIPSGEKKVSIPKKYSLPAKSGLSLTVSEGSQIYDIPLK